METEELFYVYAIVSNKDNRIYVGLSSNPENRVFEHNQGKVTSTKGYRPWTWFFVRKASNRNQAREYEKYFKGGSGKEKLKEYLTKYRSRSSTDRIGVS